MRGRQILNSDVNKRLLNLETHVHSIIIHKSQKWKQPEHLSTDEQINKTWSIRILEYYSALKRRGILTQATMWMNLEDILLRETKGQTLQDPT